MLSNSMLNIQVREVSTGNALSRVMERLSSTLQHLKIKGVKFDGSCRETTALTFPSSMEKLERIVTNCYELMLNETAALYLIC